MEKTEIQKLIDANSDRISYDVNKGKSSVWRYFKTVKIDNMTVAFVKCDRCNSVLKWKSRDGTSGLSVHIDFCASKSPQQKITSLAGFSSRVPSVKLPAVVKSELTDVIVHMCATDIRYVFIIIGIFLIFSLYC